MVSIGPFVQETVEKVQHVGIIACDLFRFLSLVLANRFDPLRGVGELGYLLEDFDFIIRGIQVMRC